VNDDDLTFATTRPVAGQRSVLVTAAPALPTPISRGVAVAGVYDMLVTGEATAADVVRCLVGVLERETSAAVVEPYLALACTVAEQWSPDRERADLTAAVADVARRLAADPARRQVALRAFARTATNPDDLTWLAAEAGDDVDLHWRALIRRATLGGDTADAVADLLARDPDPDATFRALAVRAATPDAEAKEAVWQTVAVERAVPVGSLAEVATAFWRPGQDGLLRPYARRFVDLLPDLVRGGMLPAKAFTGALFPLYGVDAQLLSAVTAAAESSAPVVRATVLEKADLVRRILRSRG
jgi:aminopeptidase N